MERRTGRERIAAIQAGIVDGAQRIRAARDGAELRTALLGLLQCWAVQGALAIDGPQQPAMGAFAAAMALAAAISLVWTGVASWRARQPFRRQLELLPREGRREVLVPLRENGDASTRALAGALMRDLGGIGTEVAPAARAAGRGTEASAPD